MDETTNSMISLFLAVFLAATASPKVLSTSLDPSSVSQQLAFYSLYPQTPEGQKALENAWKLLSGEKGQNPDTLKHLVTSSQSALNSVVALVNKHPDEEKPQLTDTQLNLIEKLAQRLPHTKLKGHRALTEVEVLQLPPHEIDIARGLLLSQMGESPEALRSIRSYEAMIDLMALQILVQAPFDSTPEQKIRAINHFIFDELRFRFPPHSLYAKDIDLYTFLPSVLDSRQGVCLGVSILYASLAQRLGLILEAITPPGHIYLRWNDGSRVINIETTARGIDLESEVYLGIDTRSLQVRNQKEMIGMAHFNQASLYWEEGEYAKAIAGYQKAEKYVDEDPLITELLGYAYCLNDDEETGHALLNKIKDHLPDHAVSKETLSEDILLGNVDKQGIAVLFHRVDETRESVLKKKEELEQILAKQPNFRSGWFHLAVVWLQLHRNGEALEVLKKYHTMYPFDATAEYYLSQLYAERLDFNQAWEHYRLAEQLTTSRNHYPKALKELRRALAMQSPEYQKRES